MTTPLRAALYLRVSTARRAEHDVSIPDLAGGRRHMLESAGQQTVTPAMIRKFAATARERIRITGGGYRRDRLRALAQRVEVADGEVRIIGSRSNLLHTLVGTFSSRPAPMGVRSSVPKWRPVGDSNPCCRRERAVSWASRRTGRGRSAIGQAGD